MNSIQVQGDKHQKAFLELTDKIQKRNAVSVFLQVPGCKS